jgi:hypothetical protein
MYSLNLSIKMHLEMHQEKEQMGVGIVGRREGIKAKRHKGIK